MDPMPERAGVSMDGDLYTATCKLRESIICDEAKKSGSMAAPGQT